MSRRNTTKKRLAVPDPIYNSRLVSMLTVRILKEGKKHLAQRIIYQAFDIIKEKTGEEPLTCLLYTSPSPRDVEESRMPSSA